MGKWSYGIVLDAGSSGTRLHVYKWLKSDKALDKAKEKELHRLPAVTTEKKWTKKIKPGISTFGDTPKLVGDDYLGDLYKHALDIVPKDEVANTPIFLLATAGMRMLKDVQRKAVLDQVCAYTRKTTKFQLPDCDLHIQVIPGETEGLYGWLAANYLLGGFDQPDDHNHGKGHHTYGFLDMGGASAQIAFAPNVTVAEEHADDLKLVRLRNVDGQATEYRVFVTTWLEYGVNEARRRYLETLAEETDFIQAEELPDPCLPVGLRVTHDIKGSPILLLGTGKFKECESRSMRLLDKDATCSDPPCPFHGIHVPPIDFDVNHFVGVSEYWHTTHEIFEFGHTDKAYDYETYQERVLEFCSMDWSIIQDGLDDHKWGKKVDEETAEEVCFKASWLINMLHEGIGIPRVGLEESGNTDGNTTKHVLDKAKQEGYLAPFQAVHKIDHTEVSWTLGKMILYASSQMPPKTPDTLAVGFGSNMPGHKIPTDFQQPGGPTTSEHTISPVDNAAEPSIKPQTPTTNTPSESYTPSTSSFRHRTPGLLLILLILLVIGILLCGRDRRASTFSRIRSVLWPRRSSRRHRFPQTTSGPSINSSRSRARGFASKLPSLSSLTGRANTSGPKYERILEEGGAAGPGVGNVYSDADIPQPADFELASLSSDSADSAAERGSLGSSSSSSGSARAHRAGRATPRTRSQAPFFENTAAGGGGFGRTESRERLGGELGGGGSAGESTGHRSRNGSPNRWRSPLAGLGKKGNLD